MSVLSPGALGRSLRHPLLAAELAVDRLWYRWQELDEPGDPPPVGESGTHRFLSEITGLDRREAERALEEVPWAEINAEIRARLAPHRLPVSAAHLGPPRGGSLEAHEVEYAIVRWLRPKRIVECGADLAGGSTAFLLAALEANGTGELYSWQRLGEAPLYAVAAGQGVPSRFESRLHRLGRAGRARFARFLDTLGSVELFVHGPPGPPGHLRAELESVSTHLAEGGLILLHDGERARFEQYAPALQVPPIRLRYPGGQLVAFRPNGRRPGPSPDPATP